MSSHLALLYLPLADHSHQVKWYLSVCVVYNQTFFIIILCSLKCINLLPELTCASPYLCTPPGPIHNFVLLWWYCYVDIAELVSQLFMYVVTRNCIYYIFFCCFSHIAHYLFIYFCTLSFFYSCILLCVIYCQMFVRKIFWPRMVQSEKA